MITATNPTPTASLEEHIDFFNQTALISLHDTQTNIIYYPAQVLADVLYFFNVEKLMTHETWMQAMSSFRQRTGRLASRWVRLGNPPVETLLIDKAFLVLPELAKFLARDRQLPTSPPPLCEKARWEQIWEQASWSEEEFTHLLAVTFIDYGACRQQERRTNVETMRTLAFDGRTPFDWALRLQRWLRAIELDDDPLGERREITLAHLTAYEILAARFKEPPYIPRPNL